MYYAYPARPVQPPVQPPVQYPVQPPVQHPVQPPPAVPGAPVVPGTQYHHPHHVIPPAQTPQGYAGEGSEIHHHNDHEDDISHSSGHSSPSRMHMAEKVMEAAIPAAAGIAISAVHNKHKNKTRSSKSSKPSKSPRSSSEGGRGLSGPIVEALAGVGSAALAHNEIKKHHSLEGQMDPRLEKLIEAGVGIAGAKAGEEGVKETKGKQAKKKSKRRKLGLV